MTKPSEATPADQEPEAIEDLDVTGDDANRVAGGGGKQQYLTFTMSNATVSS